MSEEDQSAAARRLAEQRRAVERAKQAGGSIKSGGHGGSRPESRTSPGDAWADQTSWPLETDQFVFLGTAVLRLGRAQHGERWAPTSEERHAVAKAILQACINGALRSWYRLKGGGSFEPISPSQWFYDDWRKIVDACAIVVDLRLIRYEAWLFVDGEQLDQMIMRAGRAPEWAPVTARMEAEAEEILRSRCKAHLANEGEMPVKARFGEEMRSKLSERALDRVWSNVAADYPFLSGQKGKRRPRRP